MGRNVKDIVVEHVRSTKRTLRIAGIASLPIGFLAYLIPDAHAAGIYMFIGMGLVIGGALIALSLGDPEKHKSLALLEGRPGDIVWAYVHKTTGQNQSSSVMLGTIDGQLMAVPAKVGDELELFEAVAGVAKRATLGFDPAHARTFKNDPSALQKAA